MNFKTLQYLILNWFIIFLTVLICQVFPWFYLFGFFIIANRQFANYLVGHEGVHGVISKKSSINDLISKYFCLYPVFVSLEMYRLNHLAHHEFLGTRLDPDKNLYHYYPVEKKKFLINLFKKFLNFSLIKDFIRYFTPFFVLTKMRGLSGFKKGDFLEYFITQVVSLFLIFALGLHWLFLKYWLAPLFLMIPYYYFVSALQHGLIHEMGPTENSRNIIGSTFAMECLLPCKTNYHGVHHEYPHVACWDLEKISDKKKYEGESFKNAVEKLFRSNQ